MNYSGSKNEPIYGADVNGILTKAEEALSDIVSKNREEET